MVEKKDNPSNAELLKIASDIVMSEYLTRKNDIHEKWIVESLYLWQTQGTRLSYPQLPPYPTDKDILEKAKSLVKFLNTPRPDLGEDSMADNKTINTITINNNNKQALKKVAEKKVAKESVKQPAEGLFEKIFKLTTFFKKP